MWSAKASKNFTSSPEVATRNLVEQLLAETFGNIYFQCILGKTQYIDCRSYPINPEKPCIKEFKQQMENLGYEIRIEENKIITSWNKD